MRIADTYYEVLELLSKSKGGMGTGDIDEALGIGPNRFMVVYRMKHHGWIVAGAGGRPVYTLSKLGHAALAYARAERRYGSEAA